MPSLCCVYCGEQRLPGPLQDSQPVGLEESSSSFLPTRHFVLAGRDGIGAPWLELESFLEKSCKGSHELHN